MSTVTVTLSKNLGAALPAGNAPFASTLLTLTDSTGAAQQASVTGAESPPWTAVFSNVAAGPGEGTVVAQDLDTAGAPIGAAVSQSFTEIGSPPATFPQTTGITVAVA